MNKSLEEILAIAIDRVKEQSESNSGEMLRIVCGVGLIHYQLLILHS